MGLSINEFWNTNPILFYLLVDKYNTANTVATSKENKDTKVYYKEDL